MRSSDRPVVAVDAMGGDHAPKEVIKGALIGAARENVRLIFVGDEAVVRRYLAHLRPKTEVEVVHAPEIIQMGENPALAIRRKRDSSVVKAAELVRDGRADAMVSAGSTGASMAVAALIMGRLPGIDRPAIATVLPTAHHPTVLLDAGANVDSSVENLVQFAVMGEIYSRDVLQVAQPRVGLLSIGEEPKKGNELVKTTHKELAASGLNFVGNIEGGPLFAGAADVVVCDGFVGNVTLKVAEGVVELLFETIREKLWGHPWYRLMLLLAAPGLLGMSPGLWRIHKALDRAEYGGAPLLGVNGICIISHGNSKAKAIASAVGVAARAHRMDILGRIRKSLELPDDAATAV